MREEKEARQMPDKFYETNKDYVKKKS